MARTKIDYGIDLGTTNSAISRMENGNVTLIKIAGQGDTMPSCVAFNKKGILVGNKAFAAYRSEKERALTKNIKQNAFIEFKRTMGKDKTYYSSHLGKELTSEELSAEVLKTLKSFVKDENINSIVITVPAAFKINQIDATRRAGKLAGFNHVEILQEPVAASMAYGLNTKNKNGFWLVFDFGGGTFDAALLKVEEGIMKVIDTEGDNYLGGKNLDYAIVDEILIPHIKMNFPINNLLENDLKKQNYREALKPFAEELKNELSFSNSYNLYKEDRCGFDDNNEEIEIDITVSQTELENILSPIFQKAIDLSLELLKRNNLNSKDLDSLILVGGPTYSPVLRKMLAEQIIEPDTSADPMTVVSTGAALYASTIDISEEVRDKTRDKTKIQLEIANETSTIEKEIYIPIKILEEKTEGNIPDKVFAEITRSDKAWSSGKVEINTTGEIIEVQLIENKTNAFDIVLYDEAGNLLDCEPNSFTVIQGSKIGSSTLPYNIGIEIKQKTTGKIVFSTVQNLEKNKSLPATGTKNGLKTQNKIRPGIADDFIKIPIYQGNYGADGTRAVYNEHVYDVIINGNDLPALLPENSDVDITINIDTSQKMTLQAYFPYLDYTAEIKIPSDNVQSVETNWLENEIKKAKGSLTELKQTGKGDNEKLEKIENELNQIEKSFNNNKNDVDNKHEVLGNLRKTLKVLDDIDASTEWPTLEAEIKEEFYRLEKANNDLGNEKTTQLVNQLKQQVEEVLRTKDVKFGNIVLEEIHSLFFKLTMIYQLIGFIRHHHENFGAYSWTDPNKARTLLNKGLQIIGEKPDVDDLHPIIISLIDLLPPDERPNDDDRVLVGN